MSAHPTLSIHGQLDVYLHHLHAFLSSFTYNTSPGPEHTPGIQLIKSQPLRVVCQTAHRIVAARLPIKCLEGVVVALQLTTAVAAAGLRLPTSDSAVALSEGQWRLMRLALRFHSECGGHRYWHVLLVLELQWADASSQSSPPAMHRRFAIISASRHPPLSFRSFSHPSLSSLCSSLKAEYHRIGHRLLHLTLGLPIEESERSKLPLHWHFLSIPLTADDDNDARREVPPSSLQCQSRPSPSADDAVEEEVSDEWVGSASMGVRKESSAAAREWKVVSRIVDRYADVAPSLLQRLRLNLRSPSIARPLPPLHPLVHWEQRTHQMLYVHGKKGHHVTGGKANTVAERGAEESKEVWTERPSAGTDAAAMRGSGRRRPVLAARSSRAAFAV